MTMMPPTTSSTTSSLVSDLRNHDKIMFDALINLSKELGIPPAATDGLEKAWKAQEEIVKSQTATAEEKAAAQRYLNGLAKGLPALTAGIRDAYYGFSGGDPLAGSAAIMDICATIASIGGAMSAAGGPPGALVGAIFSIVSMILRMFVKQQRSLTSQLEEIIRSLEAEQELQHLTVAQQAIGSFIDTLMPAGNDPSQPVKYKWTMAEIDARLNVIEGPSINAIRGAAAWLGREKSQDLALWGNVLAAQCQAYVNYMYAMTIAVTSLDLTGLPDGGAIVEGKLTRAFRSNDQNQLNFLRRIVPAAQNRGIVWHTGWSDTGQQTDVSHLLVRDTTTGDWKDLGHSQYKIAVAKRKTIGAEDANPYVAVFSAQADVNPNPVPTQAFRNRKIQRLYLLEGMWPLGSHSGWHSIPNNHGSGFDMAATPGEKEHEVYLYLANGSEIVRYTNVGGATVSSNPDPKVPESGDKTRFPWVKGYTVDSVNVAAWPRTVDGYNPEELEDVKWVIYGSGVGPDGNRYIRMCYSNDPANCEMRTLDTPGNAEFTGMAVDSTRFWIFTRGFIASVTHSDAKRYALEKIEKAKFDWTQGKRPKVPEWAEYTIPDEFRGSDNDGNYHGLRDIAPCDDGTLLAVFRVKGSNQPRIYCAAPSYERNAGKLIIETVGRDHSGQKIVKSGWIRFDERDREGRANRVYKLPIFCWPMIERLTTVLEKRIASEYSDAPAPRAATHPNPGTTEPDLPLGAGLPLVSEGKPEKPLP